MTPRTPATPASDTVFKDRPAQLPCSLCWVKLEKESFRTHYATCKVLKDTRRPWVCAFTGNSLDNKSEIIDWLRKWTHDRLVSVMMQDGSTSTVPAWVWITTYCEYAKERQRLAANPNTRSIAAALDQQITRMGFTMSRLPMVSAPSERQLHSQTNTTADPGLAYPTPQGQSQNHDVVDRNSRPQSAISAGHSFNGTPGNPTAWSPPHSIPGRLGAILYAHGHDTYTGNSSPQPPTGYRQDFPVALTYSGQSQDSSRDATRHTAWDSSDGYGYSVSQPVASQNLESAAQFDTTSTQPNLLQAPHDFGNLTGFNNIDNSVAAKVDPHHSGWQPNYYTNGNAMMPPQPHMPDMVMQDHAVASAQNAFSNTPQHMGGPYAFPTASPYPFQQYTVPAQPLHMNAAYGNFNHRPQSVSHPPFAYPTEHQDEITRGYR